ncbi:MAG: Gfo/Idh/MocA family oxidoreductase [Pseudomonadota bacterium]
MSETIRWGILGAANFARKTMGPAIHAAHGAELAALATSSADKAAGFAAFAPGLRVHASYDALLADPEIDAVYIPLPNHLHVEWCVRALAAGKPVLCEKPIAMAEGEFDQLIAARDAAGLMCAEAYMILHHPQWQRARALVSDGAIGEIVHVQSAFTFDLRDMSNIRNRPETGGGGLRDIGVYTIGSARFATGHEPTGWTARIAWENDVDVAVEAAADLGPARFTFRVGIRAERWQEVLFHGTTGLIRLPAPFNAGEFGEAELHLIRPGRETITEAWPVAAQYVNQVETFGETVRNGTPYPVPLEWSRGTQAAIDAIFAAAG